MTNPTSNFGWQMPTPTDLVTDLPADFEVFGQAVDSDFADLLGGANGYILSKASATDLDFAWIPNDQGDITAVNVTAPITGGGSAGAVTIGVSAASTSASGVVQLSDSTSTTSSVLASTPTATKSAYDLADTANTTANAAIAKSTVTTAGDIIYRNATVPTRLGIGTAGQVLQVNSGATAPEWATPTATSGPAFAAYLSANQTVSINTWTKIQFNTEEFDTDNNFNNTSTYRFTPTKAGKYQVNLALIGDGANNYCVIYKNGTIFKILSWANLGNTANGSALVSMNGTTDYLEFFGYITTNSIFTGGQENTFVSAAWIRS